MRTGFRFPLAVAAVAALAFPALAAPNGEEIYSKQCAWCHGKAGEGTKRYNRPLAGDKSVGQLADVIERTMPEDDPGSLAAEDAKVVASYVYGAFYSPEARARNRPARVDLSRLTVNQYRNAVADLVGGFRPAARLDDARGLKGEYYSGRTFHPNQRGLERTDPQVAFDFKTASPGEKIDPHEFAIRWTGSLLTPETGYYEFVVRSDQAVRLWVNDPNRAVIDAWVKSGPDQEFRGSVFLLAGRAYPIRLEFSKALQGVQDKKAKEKPPGPAFVTLAWKPPFGVVEPIPTRHLAPKEVPPGFAVETPFPPDDKSMGWDRGTTVSKEWDQATTNAAFEVAGYVVEHVDELAGTGPARRRPGGGSGNPASINLDETKGEKTAANRPAKLRAFAHRFAERAFRRPLTADLKKVYVDGQFEAVNDPAEAVKRVVLLVLKSPRFLYREVGGRPGTEGYDVAARLAFELWDSIPDQELIDAAAKGQLSTREQVLKQAERMLADPRARAKVKAFYRQWLKIDPSADIAKDPKKYPGYDATILADLRTSLSLFLDDVTWGSKPDFRELLLSEKVYLNGRLAKFYGADLPADAPFQPVALDPGKRAGVLTHPYLMTAFAYVGMSSPVHRGVFLARGVLGRTLHPPMDAFTPFDEALHPKLTTRERVSLQTGSAQCQACHGLINSLGFTLEAFDAVGRYREKDNAKPVDATGSYQTRSGDTVKFAGARDLATYLAESEEVHAAFAEQLFHHLVQQPVRAYGPNTLADLRRSFARSGFDIRKLMSEVATTGALGPPKGSPTSTAPPNPVG